MKLNYTGYSDLLISLCTDNLYENECFLINLYSYINKHTQIRRNRKRYLLYAMEVQGEPKRGLFL